MAFKEEIANNLTQGGVKSDIDWMDMLALALPAVVSKDPEAPTRAMKFWQMGREMREAREQKRREELGQQQYAGMVGEYINNMQQQAALAQKRGLIENMPSTVTTIEKGYGTDETGQFNPAAEMGTAPTVEVSNQEKLRQLAEWDKEASKLNNSFDAAALMQKYPYAPPNLVATLMMEHFKMKRSEANEQIKASQALALEERKHKQAIELKKIDTDEAIRKESAKGPSGEVYSTLTAIYGKDTVDAMSPKERISSYREIKDSARSENRLTKGHTPSGNPVFVEGGQQFEMMPDGTSRVYRGRVVPLIERQTVIGDNKPTTITELKRLLQEGQITPAQYKNRILAVPGLFNALSAEGSGETSTETRPSSSNKPHPQKATNIPEGAVLVPNAKTKQGGPVYKLKTGQYWTP